MPGVDFTKMMTEDGMHLEPDGLLQCEMRTHPCLYHSSHPASYVVIPTPWWDPQL